MLLISASDRFDNASWASMEPLSARRRRSGRALDGKALLLGRDDGDAIGLSTTVCSVLFFESLDASPTHNTVVHKHYSAHT